MTLCRNTNCHFAHPTTPHPRYPNEPRFWNCVKIAWCWDWAEIVMRSRPAEAADARRELRLFFLSDTASYDDLGPLAKFIIQEF